MVALFLPLCRRFKKKRVIKEAEKNVLLTSPISTKGSFRPRSSHAGIRFYMQFLSRGFFRRFAWDHETEILFFFLE